VPLVKGLAERYAKFTAKTPPDITGARYAASKEIAVKRMLEYASATAAAVELARNVLETSGVPAAQHGVYYAFVQKVRKAAFSHSGADLKAIVEGLKALFTAKGADPTVLDTLAKLIIGG
jgi:hypothetical protein